MERKTDARNVLMKLLKREGVDETTLADVRRADAFVDEALDALDAEEPALMGWLNSPEVNELLRVQTAASYALIIRDNQRGVPLEQMVHRLQTLNYRAICALSLAAAMRERPGVTDWEARL